jgi:hypothetical protein
VQRDFSLLQTKIDFLERDDLDLRNRSLRQARNVQATISGAVEARPGTQFIREIPNGTTLWEEIWPENDVKRFVYASDTDLYVMEEDGTIDFTTSSVGWTSADDLWMAKFRDQVVIGHPTTGMQVLSYNGGAWSLDDWTFATTSQGESAQPFWSFNPGTSITPSADSGSITVTATAPVFTAAHVGSTIRYAGSQIEITGYTSATEVDGTVSDANLPPSYAITFNWEARAFFTAGNIVICADSGFQGVIAQVAFLPGSPAVETVYVVALNQLKPEVGEILSGPSFSDEIVSVTEEGTPRPTSFWDESLMSDARGWPGSGAAASGRMIFCNFPELPDVIVGSSVRAINDIEIGAADDDGFARREGDGSPRFLHAINAGDLLLLADRGLYVVPLREGAALSPTTFNAELFDHRGASSVKPALVGRGIVFGEAGGRKVGFAYLDGNVVLKWNVRTISEMYDDIITEPVHICGPAADNSLPERYLIITNADGTAAAMRYFGSLDEATTGFSLWRTNDPDNFLGFAPIFGGYYAIVDRDVDGSTKYYIEKLDADTYVDCAKFTAAGVQPDMSHLRGETIQFYDNGYDLGDRVMPVSGAMGDQPDMADGGQAGLAIVSTVAPWPKAVTDSMRDGRFPTRTFMFHVSVQGTGLFDATCNNHTRTLGGYDVGSDLSEPPPVRTKPYRIPFFGRSFHPLMVVKKVRPGPFKILQVGQEVQY